MGAAAGRQEVVHLPGAGGGAWQGCSVGCKHRATGRGVLDPVFFVVFVCNKAHHGHVPEVLLHHQLHHVQHAAAKGKKESAGKTSRGRSHRRQQQDEGCHCGSKEEPAVAREHRPLYQPHAI